MIMIATTAEHTLNGQPTPLPTALVANCVRLDKTLPTYYPEYFIRWKIDATSDIHMTYNTNPDAIVQRCHLICN